MYAALVPLDERLETLGTPGECAGDERFVLHAARTSTWDGVAPLRRPSSWTCGASCDRGASCASSCRGSGDGDDDDAPFPPPRREQQRSRSRGRERPARPSVWKPSSGGSPFLPVRRPDGSEG